jgi:hypothetical protein
LEALRQRRGGLEITPASAPLPVFSLDIDSVDEEMSFDQLKREAANLERQLEDKISRYQQVNKYIV